LTGSALGTYPPEAEHGGSCEDGLVNETDQGGKNREMKEGLPVLLRDLGMARGGPEMERKKKEMRTPRGCASSTEGSQGQGELERIKQYQKRGLTDANRDEETSKDSHRN
jgi:hypothetical protein